VYEGSFFPISSFVVVCVLDDSHSNRGEVVLICISIMARDVEHFLCVFWPLELLSLKKLCSVHCPFLHWVIDFWGEFSFLSSLYILMINSLSDV
jgi:hypothetical protein